MPSLNLKDYLLNGRALGRAFVSDSGDVYIVKDIRVADNRDMTAIIDADFIIDDEFIKYKGRRRLGLPLGGSCSHLYDRKATFSEIRKSRRSGKLVS